MEQHDDVGTMKGEPNPYLKELKQPITIRLDTATVAFFNSLAGELGMPYQNLVNLYLRHCAAHERKLDLRWLS